MRRPIVASYMYVSLFLPLFFVMCFSFNFDLSALPLLYRNSLGIYYPSTLAGEAIEKREAGRARIFYQRADSGRCGEWGLVMLDEDSSFVLRPSGTILPSFARRQRRCCVSNADVSGTLSLAFTIYNQHRIR